jgi:cytoskeleton protein RodZ
LDPKSIEELRKTRLDKKITLQEISSATRINVRFLEAIEQGDFDILPKPYIKSFIKQYSRYVGFDENIILKQIEDRQDVTPREEKAEPSVAVPYSPRSESLNTPKLKIVFLVLIALGVIALFVYVLINVFDSPEEQVAERPFQDVVREIEEEADRMPLGPPETSSPFDYGQRDSLSLAITVIDTVWLTITVDNVIQEEYIFPPGTRQRWKAANDFLLTVGNAGGVAIMVNDDSIGVLGTQGQVVRNLHVTRDGIQR